MLCHPFAGHALGLGDLVGGHLASGDIPSMLRLFVTLQSRKMGPHVRQYDVLRHAPAGGVYSTEVVLRPGIALLGGQAPPLPPRHRPAGRLGLLLVHNGYPALYERLLLLTRNGSQAQEHPELSIG